MTVVKGFRFQGALFDLNAFYYKRLVPKVLFDSTIAHQSAFISRFTLTSSKQLQLGLPLVSRCYIICNIGGIIVRLATEWSLQIRNRRSDSEYYKWTFRQYSNEMGSSLNKFSFSGTFSQERHLHSQSSPSFSSILVTFFNEDYLCVVFGAVQQGITPLGYHGKRAFCFSFRERIEWCERRSLLSFVAVTIAERDHLYPHFWHQHSLDSRGGTLSLWNIACAPQGLHISRVVAV